MSYTETPNINLKKIQPGTESGTWGSTTNDNWDIVDTNVELVNNKIDIVSGLVNNVSGDLSSLNHNDINNIQGGSVTERYHLTQNIHDQITELFDGDLITGHNHDHNLLSGLQGGTTNEYYHVTENIYSGLVNSNQNITNNNPVITDYDFKELIYRQAIINGGCQVAQRNFHNHPTYYVDNANIIVGEVDMFGVKGASQAADKVTLTQATSANYSSTGNALKIGSLDLDTTSRTLYIYHRIEALDAYKLYNKNVSFSCKIYTSVARSSFSALPIKIQINGADSADDFSSVTNVYSDTTMDLTEIDANKTLAIKENMSLSGATIKNGLEIIITIGGYSAGSDLGDFNIEIGDFQLNVGPKVLDFVPMCYSEEYTRAMRFLYVQAPQDTGDSALKYGVGLCTSVDDAYIVLDLPSNMRVPISDSDVTFSAANTFDVLDDADNNVTSISIDNGSNHRMLTIHAVANGSYTAGYAALLYGSASSYMIVSAELF